MGEDQPIRLPGTDARKPRRSAVARVLGWLVGLAFLTGVAAAVAGSWLYANYTAPGPLKSSVIVDVPRNLDRMQIAHLLHDKGVVNEPMTMGLAAIVQAYRGATMKAGEYEFPAASSMADVFNIMASGRVVTYKLTVPEGWTSEMAVNRLRDQEAMTGEIASVPAEGAIIANTYLFSRGTDRQKLLDEMVGAQTKLVDEIWQKRPADSILSSKEEMVTLASIVEKETAKPEERPRVAAVFINRLKAGMRLQSDPTIIYGIAGGKGKLDRPITQADIEAETPYNTYRIKGLPPGPIATPGKESLEAVINPAPVSDLYFVADGSGGHVFAATLEEHNANVKKWRAIEQGAAPALQPDAVPQAGDTAAADAPAAPEPQQAALPNVAEEEAATAVANQNAADPVPEPAAPVAAAPEPDAAAAPATKDAAAKDAAAKDAAAKKEAAKKEAAAKDAAEKAAGEAAAPALKPGTLVKVGDTLVPIPALKKTKP